MSFNSYGDFGSDLFGPDPLEYADSYGLLHDYQKRAITGKREDYNYEFDRFPKNFIYSKSFQGAQSNPYASKLDQFHTETFLTNKVRNIEKVYVGSNELPEPVERTVLPQTQPLIEKPCGCTLCKQKTIGRFEHESEIAKAIEELEKKNDILTLILVFIVVYCLVQLVYQKGYSAYTQSTMYVAPSTPSSAPSSPAASPTAPIASAPSSPTTEVPAP